MSRRRSTRGTSFIVLDVIEANLARLALDEQIRQIELRIGDPHYAGIEGLNDLLRGLRALRARLQACLDRWRSGLA
jgi:hypothetical protein